MKKRVAVSAVVISCIGFLIGLILIFSAPSIGKNAGDAAIRNNGGTIDTEQFERTIDSTTLSYQIGGLAISLIGGFGILISGYALYKEV